jgi:hypothetical protein
MKKIQKGFFWHRSKYLNFGPKIFFLNFGAAAASAGTAFKKLW